MLYLEGETAGFNADLLSRF